MRTEIEGFIFFIPVIFSIIYSFVYTYFGVKEKKPIKKMFYVTLLINFIIYVLAILLWTFAIAIGDGMSLVVGDSLYLGLFVITEIILGTLFYFLSKKLDTKSLETISKA